LPRPSSCRQNTTKPGRPFEAPVSTGIHHD